MYKESAQVSLDAYETMSWQNDNYMPTSLLICNWKLLREQLVKQWPLVSKEELDITGANCARVSSLIAGKYGINPSMVENYLRNCERTMPLY